MSNKASNKHNRHQRRKHEAAKRKVRREQRVGAGASDERLQGAAAKVESLQQQAQLAGRILNEAKSLRKSLPFRHSLRSGLAETIEEASDRLTDIRADAVVAAEELLSVLEERHRKLTDGEARIQVMQPNSPDADKALREGSRIVAP